MEVLGSYWELISRLRKEHNILAQNEWDMDGFEFGLGQPTECGFLVRHGRNAPQAGDWVSTIEAVNALGHSIPSYVMANSELPVDDNQNIICNLTGRSNPEHAARCLQHFAGNTTQADPAEKRLLIMEGHEFHTSVRFWGRCHNNGIVTICSPPCLSSRFQPLAGRTFKGWPERTTL